jgi:hypothetical protein
MGGFSRWLQGSPFCCISSGSHPAVYQGWHLGEGVLYGMRGSVETGGREDSPAYTSWRE